MTQEEFENLSRDDLEKLKFVLDSNGDIAIRLLASLVQLPWGSLTGTLSNQTDLQDALNLKLNSSAFTAGAIKTSYESNADTNAFVDAEKTKVGFISVTQAVDLDDIETKVNNLDSAVVLKGVWDASVGTFPGGGTAQAGYSYIVSVAGTVDGIDFNVNDRIIAILDNASTTIYASNWIKSDYTDQVLSVNGQTGAVIVDVASTNTDLVAGVDVTAGDVLRFGALIEDIISINEDGGQTQRIGWTLAGGAFQCQSFTVTNNSNIASIQARLKKVNSPVGNLNCEIYSDLGITLVATASNTIVASSLSTVNWGTFQTFNFSNELLTAGTYYIKITNNGTRDGTHHSIWSNTATSLYAGGNGYVGTDPNVWGITTTNDKNVIIELIDGSEDKTKVYKASATLPATARFVGLAQASVLAGANVGVAFGGLSGNVTGLTPGSVYYLSDTAGLLSLTAGTIKNKVGIANDTNKILIQPQIEEANL